MREDLHKKSQEHGMNEHLYVLKQLKEVVNAYRLAEKQLPQNRDMARISIL